MSKTWNDEQLQAIQSRGTNVLVSASAGSGKTGVLVQRLVELVTVDGVEIDEILAMTFSEDAAGEMKKRLFAEITELCVKEKDLQRKAYLNSQLSKLSNAHISTIHSFCYSIIKEYYYLCNLDSNRIQNLCDESMQVLYQRQALDEIIELEMKRNEPAFYALCSMSTARPENLDGLREMIMKTAAMADSQSDAEMWLNHALQTYDSESFYLSKTYEVFLDYWHGQMTLYLQAFDTAKQQLEEHYPDQHKRLLSLMTKYEAAQNAAAFHHFDELRAQIITATKLPFPTSPDSTNQTFKKAREAVQAIEDEIIGTPPCAVMNHMLTEIKPIVAKLIDCVRQYFIAYETIKKKQEVIDFSDMEHFALKILKENDFVCEHYKNLFKHIMVDEFQDSNDVQDELIRLIARKNNVFRVGDVKQSIYGFRHALPSIMQSYKTIQDKDNQVIRFNRNYRSDASIIEFNNVLFEILMNIDGFNSLPFLEEDRSQPGITTQYHQNQPIVFHALDPKLHTYENEKINKDIYKAEYIAHEILEQSKTHEFKEMAVLVRSNAKMDVLKQVFDKYHIPYYMNHKSGFYDSSSIQILISLLTSFCDPSDDFSFAALLTSRFFNIDSDTLAIISNRKKGSYYSYMMQHEPDKMHHYERIRTSGFTISEIISECFRWNDFYETCSLQDQTNCDYFYQTALEYENKYSCEMASFLCYLENAKQQETAQTSTIGKNDNVVRFMSIHNSKGLEFPIVYLWATSNMKKMDNSDLVLCDNELGIGFTIMQFPYRNVFKSYQRIAIEHKQNRDEIEEELRILYVATTRAKKQLHIVDFLDPKLELHQGINYTKINDRKGTTSWILQAMTSLNRTDLFTLNYVDAMWTTVPLPLIQQKAVSIQRYPDIPHLEFISPSDTEELYDVQPLSFTENMATSRGTLYHAYLEKLPNTKWDATMIKELSVKEHWECDDKLLQALLTLNEHPLFDSLRSTTIIHEYPFLVRTEHQILHGYMDYLSIGETITLIDFKSDVVDHAQILTQRYTDQINAYKKACELLYPDKKVNAFIYSFSLSQMIKM